MGTFTIIGIYNMIFNSYFIVTTINVFSGRNQGFRHNFSSYAEWEKTYGYNISSDSGSESDNDDSDSEGKKNGGKNSNLKEKSIMSHKL